MGSDPREGIVRDFNDFVRLNPLGKPLKGLVQESTIRSNVVLPRYVVGEFSSSSYPQFHDEYRYFLFGDGLCRS